MATGLKNLCVVFEFELVINQGLNFEVGFLPQELQGLCFFRYHFFFFLILFFFCFILDVFDRLKLGRFQFFFLIGCFGYVGFSSRENEIFFNHKTQKEIQTGRENVKKKNL